MEKINIAELLKDCPKGMELDCTMFDDVTFVRVDTRRVFLPIEIKVGKITKYLTKEGCYIPDQFLDISPNAKCVIFPKGKTTWEGFVPPGKFKDGDILVNVLTRRPFIFKKLNNSSGCDSYCGIDSFGRFQFGSDNWTPVNTLGFATEEEKQKLFEAIKVVGYIWNPETKTLEKLIVRKSQDNLELVSDKFDIDTLKMFESRVLVRNTNTDEWRGQFYSHYYESKRSDKPYICIGVEGLCEYKQCIPYEGNEHLLGTTSDCSEYYKTWE